jgi:DNA-binding response OmpR family regulator
MGDRVLVVEDDQAVRTLIRLLLEDEGLDVVEATTGPQALERFAEGPFDLVLLDLRLPGMYGFDVCRELRRTSDVPIIMVTAQHDSHDVVAGLELGADDYVTKPFVDRELLARVRVQLRRRASAEPSAAGETIEFGDVVVRPDEGRASKAGEDLALTKTEFRLLVHLASNPNRVWSREQLLDHVWGYDDKGDGRLVDTHVARLRSKIEDDPASPTIVQTVRGLGYRLSKGSR